MPSGTLVGRDAELRVLGELIDGDSEVGAVLLLLAEPGSVGRNWYRRSPTWAGPPAAIAALHADAMTSTKTDWAQILAW
jgi:hypothetical protein